MLTEVKTVRLVTATYTIDFTTTGGWQPKFVIFQYSAGYNAIPQWYSYFTVGMGFTEVTNSTSRSVGMSSEDNVARGDSARLQRNDVPVCCTQASGTVETQGLNCSVDSWLSNGIRLLVNTHTSVEGYISALMIGGDDITDWAIGTVNTTTGASVSVSSLSFQPENGMFLCAGTTTENSPVTHGMLSVGFYDGTTQWTQGALTQDNPATMITRQNYRHDRVVDVPTTAGATDGYSTVAWDSNGFTLTNSDTYSASFPVYYLVWKGGTCKVGYDTEPTSTGDQTITTNKDVQAVMMFGNDSGNAGWQTGNMWSSGMATSSSDQICQAFEDQNGVADSITANYISNNIYNNFTANANTSLCVLDDEATFVSKSSTNFVINWSNIGQARPFRYVTFGTGVTLTEVVKQTTTKFDIIQNVIKQTTIKSDIYQEILKQVTAKFDIYQETEKSITAKFDVLQQVTKQLNMLFDIHGLVDVIKTTTMLYNILQEVPKQVTTKHDIFEEVPKSVTIKSDIYQEVAKITTVKFDILEQVVKQVTILSNIYEEILKQVTTKFDVYEETEKTTTIKFDIIQEIVKQLTILADIYEELTKQLTTKFDVYQETEKAVTVKFDIIQQVVKQLTTLFDIYVIGLTDVIKTTTVKFDIMQEVPKQTTIKFDIYQEVVKQLTMLHDIYQEVPKSITAKFDILQEVSKSTTIKYDIIQEVTKQLTVLFDILELGLVTVTKSTTTLFDIAQQISKQTTTKFDVYEEVEKQTAIKFDIMQEVAKNVSVKFDILQEVIKTNNILFNILEEVDKSTTVKFDIFETVEKDVTTLYDIAQDVVKQVSTIFDIYSIIPTVEVEKSTTMKFDILQDVEKSTAIKFAILQEIVKQLRTKFDIRGKDFIDRDFAEDLLKNKTAFGPKDATWNLTDHRSKFIYDKRRKVWRIRKA